MPQTGRTFRVFVSSTFSDLKEERNALQEKVFPRLRTLCMERGCRFQAIDLRWGVSEEASVDQQAMPICIEELHRCQKVTPRPNFIVLLGQRYGWLPIPPYIPADEFENISRHITAKDEKELIDEWYKLDKNAVPHEYVLQPRTGIDSDTWYPVESDLHTILLNAARKAGLPDENLIKYERSATEQEINEGALKAGTDDAFCYFRKIGNLPEDVRAKDFRDFGQDKKPDQAAKERLGNLKRRLKKHFPEDQVYDYGASWSEDGVTDDHLDALCERVEADLWEAILEEIESMEEKTDLEQEVDSHQKFCDDRARHFIGRETIIKKIMDYVEKGSNRPLVVYGPSGSGKSALMARCVQLVKEENPKAVLIHRFIGASAASTDIRSLLESLCTEIGGYYEQKGKAPADYRELVREFKKRLASATRDRAMIIFIDALDQLSPANNAYSLNWLRNKLPKNVRIVVSVLDREGAAGECLRKAKVKLPPESLIELKPLTVKQGEKLLDTWLDEAKRTLQDKQRADVVEKFKQCKLPLYLKLAFEEARLWHSYDGLPCGADDVPGLNADIEGVILDLLARLEKPTNHGDVMVSRALGYLAAARYGLTEDEILEVLPQDETVFHNFFERAFNIPSGIYDTIIGLLTDEEKEILGDENPEQVLLDNLSDDRELCDDILKRSQGEKIALRLPVVIWSRLYHDLEPYFTERAADGTSLMSFYHRQFGEVITAKYASGDEKAPLHKKLAKYFGARPHEFDVDEKRKTPNLRKMSELPFQQTYGEQWEALDETLTDLVFIEAKCTAGMAYDLVADYDRIGVGRARPGPIIKTAWKHNGKLGIWCPHCLAWSKVKKAQLDQVINCTGCNSKLKINPFTIDAEWHPCKPRQEVIHKEEIASAPVSIDVVEFADFIRSQVHILREYPELTFQQSMSKPDTSAPGRVAMERLASKAETRPWLRWVNKPPHRDPCIASLAGHSVSVEGCSYSPDGRHIVSASHDKTLKIWDAESGEEIATLVGHSECVHDCSYSPDGRRIVSASWDDTLKIWDAENGVVLATLSGHSGWVHACSYSSDGRRIVSASEDKTLKIWDAETGIEIGTLTGHLEPVVSCSFSPTGCCIVSGSNHFDPFADEREKTLRVWDADSGKEIVNLLGHSKRIRACSYSPDGQRIATGSADNTIKIWDADTGDEISMIIGCQGTCSWSPDGRRIVSAADNGTLKVWNAETGEELANLPGHPAGVHDCSWSPDSRRIVSSSWDHSLKIWDAETNMDNVARSGHSSKINSCSCSPDGRYIVTGSSDKTLIVWDAENGTEMVTLTGHVKVVETCSWSPSGRYIVSGSYDTTLMVWDVKTGKRVCILYRHKGAVRACSFSPDGCRIVSASDDGTLRLWSAKSGRKIAILRGHTWTVEDCAYSPDGRHIVSASPDGWLKLWDGKTGVELTSLGKHPRGVDICSYSPDGDYVISGSTHSVVLIVWNAETGSGVNKFIERLGVVIDCTYSPDGQYIAVGNLSEGMKIVDIHSRSELLRFFTGDFINDLAFSPNNKTIVVAGSSNIPYILQLENINTGRTIITAWRIPDPGKWQFWRGSRKSAIAFGCVFCRKWSEIQESDLGTELTCPKCCETVKLNPFTISGDWRRVAREWESSLSPIKPRRPLIRAPKWFKRMAWAFVVPIVLIAVVVINIDYIFSLPLIPALPCGLFVLLVICACIFHVYQELTDFICPKCGTLAELLEKEIVHCRDCGYFYIDETK